MLSTSLRSRYARRKNCGNETLPGASSLDRCSKKQRCISKMMWESRSASPRVSFVGISANAVTCPVFKAIKLETRSVTCQSCLRVGSSALTRFGRFASAASLRTITNRPHRSIPINPRFEHQQFHLLSTTDRPRPGATHLPGSNQKARAIPDDRSA